MDYSCSNRFRKKMMRSFSVQIFSFNLSLEGNDPMTGRTHVRTCVCARVYAIFDMFLMPFFSSSSLRTCARAHNAVPQKGMSAVLCACVCVCVYL